jgi:putative membrane protein
LLRWVINAIALWFASIVVPGFTLAGSIWQILIVAAIFGLVNAVLKPIVDFFSGPLIVLSLGLFTWVINTVLLLIVEVLITFLSDTPAMTIEGLMAAVLAAAIISLVSSLLNFYLIDD